jgi:hypothetical protein
VTAVILFAFTGLLASLIGGALMSGAVLGPDFRAAPVRFVRQAEEPGRYWTIMAIQAGLLALMIVAVATRLTAH